MTLGRIAGLSATIALMPIFAVSLATSVGAEDAAASAASKAAIPRLNLIDRQRMLGEMMAKGLCFIDLKVDKKAHRNQMSVAQYVFHSALDDLIEGSPGLDLPAEKHPELKKAIEQIKLAWVKYAEPLNSWTGGRWGKKEFALKVYEVDEAYEQQLTETIGLYRKVLVEAGAVPQQVAKTILAAGGQRTLTQKIAKQFCQALSDYKPAETREQLKLAVTLYKEVAAKFMSGDEEVGLSGEQPGLIQDNLQLATASFQKIEPILLAAIDGKAPSPDELDLVAATNTELLRHWEKVVATYVQLNAL